MVRSAGVGPSMTSEQATADCRVGESAKSSAIALPFAGGGQNCNTLNVQHLLNTLSWFWGTDWAVIVLAGYLRENTYHCLGRRHFARLPQSAPSSLTSRKRRPYRRFSPKADNHSEARS